MPDKHISDLDDVTIPLTGTELFPVDQGGVTKKASVDNLAAVVGDPFPITDGHATIDAEIAVGPSPTDLEQASLLVAGSSPAGTYHPSVNIAASASDLSSGGSSRLDVNDYQGTSRITLVAAGANGFISLQEFASNRVLFLDSSEAAFSIKKKTTAPPNASAGFMKLYVKDTGFTNNTPSELHVLDENFNDFRIAPALVSVSASVTGAISRSYATAPVHFLTLTGNVTITPTGGVTGQVCDLTLYLKQDGTGSRTAAWASSVKWPGGTAPVLSTAANAVDCVVLETLDGGTTWYANLAGKAYA